MRTRIYNYMKNVQIPVNHHQIARAIREREIDILRELNGMGEFVRIIPISLSCYGGGIYYELRKSKKNSGLISISIKDIEYNKIKGNQTKV